VRRPPPDQPAGQGVAGIHGGAMRPVAGGGVWPGLNEIRSIRRDSVMELSANCCRLEKFCKADA